MEHFASKCSRLLTLAKNRELEKIGIYPMEIRDCWEFKEGDEFPNEPFCVRGPNSERLYSWDRELLDKWNNGVIDDPKTYWSRKQWR